MTIPLPTLFKSCQKSSLALTCASWWWGSLRNTGPDVCGGSQSFRVRWSQVLQLEASELLFKDVSSKGFFRAEHCWGQSCFWPLSGLLLLAGVTCFMDPFFVLHIRVTSSCISLMSRCLWVIRSHEAKSVQQSSSLPPNRLSRVLSNLTYCCHTHAWINVRDCFYRGWSVMTQSQYGGRAAQAATKDTFLIFFC